MHKVLYIVILLAGLFALTGRNSAASPATPSYPQIVAKGKLLGQTQPTSVVALTPAQGGLYRVSAYATIVHADPTSYSQWYYSSSWTDEVGPAIYGGLMYQYGKQSGQFLNNISIVDGGTVTTLRVKGGTPITINMTQTGPPDASMYDLYYVVEQLM